MRKNALERQAAHGEIEAPEKGWVGARSFNVRRFDHEHWADPGIGQCQSEPRARERADRPIQQSETSTAGWSRRCQGRQNRTFQSVISTYRCRDRSLRLVARGSLPTSSIKPDGTAMQRHTGPKRVVANLSQGSGYRSRSQGKQQTYTITVASATRPTSRTAKIRRSCCRRTSAS